MRIEEWKQFQTRFKLRKQDQWAKYSLQLGGGFKHYRKSRKKDFTEALEQLLFTVRAPFAATHDKTFTYKPRKLRKDERSWIMTKWHQRWQMSYIRSIFECDLHPPGMLRNERSVTLTGWLKWISRLPQVNYLDIRRSKDFSINFHINLLPFSGLRAEEIILFLLGFLFGLSKRQHTLISNILSKANSMSRERSS